MANITLKEIIEKNMARFQKIILDMSDERAVVFMGVFPEWKQGESYVEKQRVRYNGELWRVKKALTADAEPVEGEEYEKIVTPSNV